MIVLPRPKLPLPRGPLSAAVVETLRRNELEPIRDRAMDPEDVDLLIDDDAQLALACCYELSYQSFAEVDDRWEWEPELLAVRGRLERAFVRRLEDEIRPPRTLPISAVIPVIMAIPDDCETLVGLTALRAGTAVC